MRGFLLFFNYPVPSKWPLYNSFIVAIAKQKITTKITAIAVINYNIVKVQFSYFVYEDT